MLYIFILLRLSHQPMSPGWGSSFNHWMNTFCRLLGTAVLYIVRQHNPPPPKRPTKVLHLLEPTILLLYVANRTLNLWLRLRLWDGTIILDYPRWAHFNHWVGKSREFFPSCGQRSDYRRVWEMPCCFESGERWPQAKELRQLLEAGKDKETFSLGAARRDYSSCICSVRPWPIKLEGNRFVL